MEEPFRTPELAPFRRLQFVFNERLLGLGNAPRPSSLADDVVTVDARGNITVRTSDVFHGMHVSTTTKPFNQWQSPDRLAHWQCETIHMHAGCRSERAAHVA